MNAALQIAVDLEQGEIRLGSEKVRLLPVAGDVFCLNDARGPLVRALKFEERSRLLANADDNVALRVADAALVSSGVATEEVRIAASLALAGGGEEAPSFPECVRFVEQQYGWDEKRVGETMALVIDRLCSAMVQQDSSGWKQIVFQKNDADLQALISRMASNLSQRAVASSTAKENTESPANEKHQKSSASQSSQSSTPDGFAPPPASPAHGSVRSVSSVLTTKRPATRVLALNTDRRESPEWHEIAPHPKLQQATTSTSTTTQSIDFPTTTKTEANHTNFSPSPVTARASFPLPPVTQPASLHEALTVLPPVATFPAWQPFTTSVPNTQPAPAVSAPPRATAYTASELARLSPHAASEPVSTSSRAFGVAATEAQPVTDWIAELAQLLEAECDLRGLDP